MQGYTFKPSYVTNSAGYFGAVDIIIGTRIMNTRVIRQCYADKEQALLRAAKQARAMVALGVNCPIQGE